MKHEKKKNININALPRSPGSGFMLTAPIAPKAAFSCNNSNALKVFPVNFVLVASEVPFSSVELLLFFLGLGDNSGKSPGLFCKCW